MVCNNAHMDIEAFSRTVIRNIAARMNEEGITTVALSEKTGIPRTTLTRRLTAPELSPMTITELQAIAAALNTSVVELMTVSGEEAAA